MTHEHMISTTDPITGHDIPDLEGRPFVVEGDHYHDITIYFESEENRRAYLDIPVTYPDPVLNRKLSNPTDQWIDNG